MKCQNHKTNLRHWHRVTRWQKQTEKDGISVDVQKWLFCCADIHSDRLHCVCLMVYKAVLLCVISDSSVYDSVPKSQILKLSFFGWLSHLLLFCI